MGLAERRRIAAIKQDAETAKATFVKETGLTQVGFDFDINTLSEDEKLLDGYDYYKDYLMPQVTRIFKSIASDDLGKEAVAEKIKSIKIVNSSKSELEPGKKALELKNGELLITYGVSYSSSDMWYEDDLKSKIENLL